MTVRFKRPDDEDIWQLAHTMRAPDVAELRAASGDTPATGLLRSMRATEYPIAVIDHGEVLSMFGVGEPALLQGSGFGVPWFLANRNAHKYVRVYAEFLPPVLDMYLNAYGRLVNYVDARNTKSIRWLKRIGFTIDPPKVAGVEQRPFHRFWMEA